MKGTTDPSSLVDVTRLVDEHDTILKELQINLLKVHNQMQQHGNKHHRSISLVVGDLVYLNLQPCKWKSLLKKINDKLRPQFYGPYKITKVVGQVYY